MGKYVLRERANAGENHGVAPHALIVEWEVVDYHPEYEPMSEDAEEARCCRSVLDYLRADQRFLCEKLNPQPEGDQSA